MYHFATDDGLTYAAMELLEGETLRARLARSELTWHQSAEIALAISEGLSAAHAKGVVHRDLKPENVFLTSEGQVKLLDFGLARLEPEVSAANRVANRTNTTTPGLVMGTPGYMSPEQLRSEVAEAPGDVFSFGCVLSEMLTGRAPFARPTVAETIAATLKDEPLELTGPGVPRELDVLMRRCLQKNANDRFPSGAPLAAELKSIVSGARKSRPKRALWLLSVLALLILGGILGTRIYSSLDRGHLGAPGSVRSIAVLPFLNPDATPETELLSDGITESLINSLSHAPELQVMARTTAFKYKGKEQDPAAIGRQLGVDAVVTGRALRQGDTLLLQAELVRVSNGSQLWGEHYVRKLSDVLVLQDDLAKGISDKLRPNITVEARQRVAKHYTDNTDAYRLYLEGLFHMRKRTPKDLNKALGYFQQAVATDPNYALAYAGLAQCYSLQSVHAFGGWAPAEVTPKARAAATKALALDDALAEAHTSMGHIKLCETDLLGAEREFHRAIELNPNHATAHQYNAINLSVMARHDEAIREMKRALELDPLSIVMNTNLGGIIFRAARQPDRAIKQCLMTLEMDPGYAGAHLALGMAYEQKRMYEQAIAELETAVALSSREPAPLAELGRIYAVSGRRGDAQKVLDELKELSGRQYVAPCFIALLVAGLGNKDQAFDWLEKAYQERSSCLNRLNTDPIMDNLRSDARFADLLRRLNFPP